MNINTNLPLARDLQPYFYGSNIEELIQECDWTVPLTGEQCLWYLFARDVEREYQMHGKLSLDGYALRKVSQETREENMSLLGQVLTANIQQRAKHLLLAWMLCKLIEPTSHLSQYKK